MRVLQFAFAEDDHEYQPHHYARNTVVYTGTHDNDTTSGWWKTLDPAQKGRVRDYTGPVGEEIGWELMRTAYTSVADRAIVPVQDVFCLGTEARMNTPGQPAGNWNWRAEAGDFREGRAAGLRRLADDGERRHRIAMRKINLVFFAVAPDAQFQPARQRIDD